MRSQVAARVPEPLRRRKARVSRRGARAAGAVRVLRGSHAALRDLGALEAPAARRAARPVRHRARPTAIQTCV